MANVVATTFTYMGGQFQVGDGHTPTENFTTVTQVTEVDFSGSKRDAQDVTNADNTDATKRFQDTLFDPGDCSVSLLFNPADATHQQMRTTYNAGGRHNFKVIYLNSTGGTLLTRSFAGIITSFDFKASIDKPTQAQIKIKLSGPITDV